MGIFRSILKVFFKKKQLIVCPACRHKGAVSQAGSVRCRNSSCENFDPSLMMERYLEYKPSPAAPSHSRSITSDFDPGSNRVAVIYRNYAGEEKRYTGDRTTIHRKNNHMSLRLAPTGIQVTFNRKFILNLAELDRLADEFPEPKGRDLQILAYHMKHGTTSMNFELIRKKFCYWKP